jgi:hypothetical protein
MATLYLTPKDARGRRIRKGARVRAVGVPDLSGIRGFSRHGFAEIFFKIRSGRLAGWHGIEIEPNLLLAQRRRRDGG